MKQLFFALAVLAVLIVAADVAFLHGLTAAIVTAVTSLF